MSQTRETKRPDAATQRATILVVDDEPGVLKAIQRILKQDYHVVLASEASSALEVLKSQPVAVILADQRMPGMSGVELLEAARSIQPNAMRILITGYADIDATIAAVNQGQIFYYITKPYEPRDLRLIIQRAVEQYRLREENERLLRELQEANRRLQEENRLLHREMEDTYRFDEIIGRSPAMQRVFQMLKKVIPTDTTVLIQGETGTGKELIARAIHFNSPRRHRLFVSQNCAAVPEGLLESELFGHVKGAFTGATRDKKGLFQLADGGTIFLDEIGETSLEFQKRLLRVLQEGEVHPVGAEYSVTVNVRVIAATNRDLQEAIRQGRFREDLYYRLNVFPIVLPPLRERREDIPLLAQHFLKKYSMKTGKRLRGLAESAIRVLQEYPFPGNVRELENIIQRAVVLADENELLTAEHFQYLLDSAPVPAAVSADAAEWSGLSLRQRVEEVERFYIQEALRQAGGNISRAAQLLGLSRLGLYKKLDRYGIQVDEV